MEEQTGKIEVERAKRIFERAIPQYASAVQKNAPHLLISLENAVRRGEVKISQLRALERHYLQSPANAALHRQALQKAQNDVNTKRPAQVLRQLKLEVLRQKRPHVSKRFIAGAATALALGVGAVKEIELRAASNILTKPPSHYVEPNWHYGQQVQREMREKIEQLRRSKVLSEHDEVSVCASDGDKPLASFEPDKVRRSASLIKPFIMLAAYHKIEQGARAPRNFERDVRRMIAYSDNDAATRVLRFAGGPQAATKIIHKYGFTGTSLVEEIPHSGQSYGNTTSTADLNKFLHEVHKGSFSQTTYAENMRGHLDSYRTSRLDEEAGSETNLAGKTGYVHGAHGEATRVSIGTGNNARQVNFAVIIEDKRRPKNRTLDELEWQNRTALAIRQMFNVVKRNVEQQARQHKH